MNDNRRKLTGILKLLYENTDSEHSMDTYQIMDALESMGYGRPDRKTIDANIKYLIEDMGFGIVKEKGKPNRYRWIEREFDLAELKMLVDAVHASRFISRKKCREIVAKLKDLTSAHQAALLNRELHTCHTYKRDGSTALKSADIINDAIRSNSRISFQIAEYDIYKNELLRDDGKTFEVSPYALAWINDVCYMLGRASGSFEVSTYRVDLMRNTTQLRIPAEREPADFNIDDYSSRVFDISGGEMTEVELNCREDMMQAIIDKFGRDFYTENDGGGTFTVRVTVDTSPAFFAWVFGFGGAVTIKSPESVKVSFRKMLMDQLN